MWAGIHAIGPAASHPARRHAKATAPQGRGEGLGPGQGTNHFDGGRVGVAAWRSADLDSRRPLRPVEAIVRCALWARLLPCQGPAKGQPVC